MSNVLQRVLLLLFGVKINNFTKKRSMVRLSSHNNEFVVRWCAVEDCHCLIKLYFE